MSASSACRGAWPIYDYGDPALAPEAFSVSISVFGGLILVASGILFLIVLVARPEGARDRDRAISLQRRGPSAGRCAGRA